MLYPGMRTFSGHNGRVFVASASDIAGVTFPPVLLPPPAERASAFHLSIRHSCQIPVYRRQAGGRRGRMRWRHPRQSRQQSIKEGGRGSADALGPSPTHWPFGSHRRTGEWVSNRPTSRRPKSILGFCPAEFICLGHLTLSDFPLSPSLPPTPSCLPQSSPVVRRPSGVPGRRAPSRRNIKSVSERRYLSSRNYRGIYGPVSFVNCTRWAGSRRSLAAPKRSSFFFLGRVGDIYLIKRR